MLKRFGLALVALLLIGAPAAPALAQGISQKVAVCDPAYTGRCIAPGVDGSIKTTQAPGTSSTVSGVVATSTPTNGTVAVANTFQSVLAASTTRKGCLLQAGANPVLVYPGAPGSATAANSMTVGANGTFNCASGNTVVGDQLSITAAALPAPYTLWVQ